MKKLTLILVLNFLASCNPPKTHEIKVSRIVDGDSFISENTRYRISEIDAPEINQIYGYEAKKYLSDLILHQNVEIKSKGKDKYNREIVEVFINGSDVADLIVANGFAWQYKRYSTDRNLSDLELKARKDRRGLWKSKAVNPYQYRKSKNNSK